MLIIIESSVINAHSIIIMKFAFKCTTVTGLDGWARSGIWVERDDSDESKGPRNGFKGTGRCGNYVLAYSVGWRLQCDSLIVKASSLLIFMEGSYTHRTLANHNHSGWTSLTCYCFLQTVHWTLLPAALRHGHKVGVMPGWRLGKFSLLKTSGHVKPL